MDKKHTTTVSLTVSVDMSKPGSIAPALSLRLGSGRHDHVFTAHAEQHRLSVTQDLDDGEHTVFLHYKSADPRQGTVQIIKMHIQGVPLGTAMYEGSLHKWGTDPDDASRGVLDMTSPSSWRYPLRVPATNKYWGVGFA